MAGDHQAESAPTARRKRRRQGPSSASAPAATEACGLRRLPLSETAPNNALEPTPNSLRSCVAVALGRGSPPAFGFHGKQQVGMRPM